MPILKKIKILKWIKNTAGKKLQATTAGFIFYADNRLNISCCFLCQKVIVKIVSKVVVKAQLRIIIAKLL